MDLIILSTVLNIDVTVFKALCNSASVLERQHFLKIYAR